MAQLSYEEVARLMRADFETGKLYWKERSLDDFKVGVQSRVQTCKAWNSKFAGNAAFTTHTSGGYLHGTIHNVKYKAHRVIWLLHTGEWPPQQIDHINGIKDDNRIMNLRAVSKFENGRNQRMPWNNTSGTVGVKWHKGQEQWVAFIHSNNQRIILGNFDDKENAILARRKAEVANGYHPNHGTRRGVY